LFPWRRRPTPYSVLLAEVLLQNTPSERVVPVFEDVLRRWPTFQRLAGASVATLAAVLQPLGLQRRRALALVTVAAELVSRRRSRLPRDARDLRRLPGVGPYTAGATATVAFRRPAPFTDGGTARLIRRYFGLGTTRTTVVDELAYAVLTGGDPRARLWGLLDLARTRCRPRPLCGGCPLASRCAYAVTGEGPKGR